MLKAIIQNIHRGMSAQGPAFLMLSACLLLSACGKKEAVKPVAEAAKPAPAVSDAKIDAAITDALAAEKPNQVDVNAELEAQAEDILSQYPNKSATELLNVPEVNEALKAGLQQLAQNKKLQDQINSSVALAAKMKGLSGAPGTVGLDLDTKNYNHAQKSRMLQAVMARDAGRIVNFLTEEIGEAVPELALEGAARASNGIAIRETPAPAK